MTSVRKIDFKFVLLSGALVLSHRDSSWKDEIGPGDVLFLRAVSPEIYVCSSLKLRNNHDGDARDSGYNSRVRERIIPDIGSLLF